MEIQHRFNSHPYPHPRSPSISLLLPLLLSWALLLSPGSLIAVTIAAPLEGAVSGMVLGAGVGSGERRGEGSGAGGNESVIVSGIAIDGELRTPTPTLLLPSPLLATPVPTGPPPDPLTYRVPRSPVTLTFFHYGPPLANPSRALICIMAADSDFWEHATRQLDVEVGKTLEYRFRGVGLTVVPVGRGGLRWRTIGPTAQALRYFVQTYGAMDMLFDVSVQGITDRVATGRLMNL